MQADKLADTTQTPSFRSYLASRTISFDTIGDFTAIALTSTKLSDSRSWHELETGLFLSRQGSFDMIQAARIVWRSYVAFTDA